MDNQANLFPYPQENPIADNQTIDPPLQAELQTAQAALKTALLQLGLLSRFQRDVRTLGVQNYATKPPSNLTNTLTQALKAYNDACNSMEAQIVRAKAAILHDVEKVDEPLQEDHQQAVDTTTSTLQPTDLSMSDIGTNASYAQNPAKDVDAAIKGTPVEDSMENGMGSSSLPPVIPRAQSLINDDEMEDLFGPGTTKTDTTGSTPAMGSVPTSAPLPTDTQAYSSNDGQSQSQNGSSTQNLQTQPSEESTSFAAAEQTSGQQGDLIQLPTTFDFGETSAYNADGTGSALPDMNFDFSHMSADDFNSILASLGNSTAASGNDENGNNLLQGFNLDTDLSSYLNTDMSSDP